MKETTSFQENISWGPEVTRGSFSCRIKSGFHGIRLSWTGWQEVSKIQKRGGLVVLERVVTLLETVVGEKTCSAQVILFNQFVTHCSSEPAVGKNVPSITSSCNVPEICLCTFSCLMLLRLEVFCDG